MKLEHYRNDINDSKNMWHTIILVDSAANEWFS